MVAGKAVTGWTAAQTRERPGFFCEAPTSADTRNGAPTTSPISGQRRVLTVGPCWSRRRFLKTPRTPQRVSGAGTQASCCASGPVCRAPNAARHVAADL